MGYRKLTNSQAKGGTPSNPGWHPFQPRVVSTQGGTPSNPGWHPFQPKKCRKRWCWMKTPPAWVWSTAPCPPLPAWARVWSTAPWQGCGAPLRGVEHRSLPGQGCGALLRPKQGAQGAQGAVGGITFALYRWNANPIDRTSIPGLVGAKECQWFLGQQCC
jgi:hypothetical protein